MNAIGQQQNQFANNFSNWKSLPNKPWSASNKSNQPRPSYQYQAQSSNQGNNVCFGECCGEINGAYF